MAAFLAVGIGRTEGGSVIRMAPPLGDFVLVTYGGRTYGVLFITDECTQACLAEAGS